MIAVSSFSKEEEQNPAYKFAVNDLKEATSWLPLLFSKDCNLLTNQN